MDEQIKYFPDYETGDTYAYLDIKRETDIIVAFSVGKWIQRVCDELYELIAKRAEWPTYKRKIKVCTDGNDQNLPAMTKVWHKDSIDYGQVIKDKEQQRIIGRHKHKVFGNLPYRKISIAKIDGLCSKLRARVGCFVRKTRNFAKRRRLIINVLHITQTNHNFINDNKRVTPAMREGLLHRKWEWNDVFHVRIPFNI